MSEIATVESKVTALEAQSTALVVKNQEQYEAAAAFLVSCKTLENEILGTFDPIVEKAWAAHKEAVAQRKRHIEPFQRAVVVVKMRVATYLEDQAVKRRAEEMRLQEIAKKEAEERALQAALHAESMGKMAQAAAILEAPIKVPTVIIPTDPQPEGISNPVIYKFRVVNDLLVPREYLIVNETQIGQIVRATKGKVHISGIETYEEISIRTTAR